MIWLVVIISNNNNLKYNKLSVELSRVETLRWLIDCFRKPFKAGMTHQYDWYFSQNTLNDAPKSNETKNDSVFWGGIVFFKSMPCCDFGTEMSQTGTVSSTYSATSFQAVSCIFWKGWWWPGFEKWLMVTPFKNIYKWLMVTPFKNNYKWLMVTPFKNIYKWLMVTPFKNIYKWLMVTPFKNNYKWLILTPFKNIKCLVVTPMADS